jgi:hypothetical protein
MQKKERIVCAKKENKQTILNPTKGPAIRPGPQKQVRKSVILKIALVGNVRVGHEDKVLNLNTVILLKKL